MFIQPKSLITALTLITATTLLAACADFRRSEHSGYRDEHAAAPAEKFSSSLSDSDVDAIQNKRRLQALESRLQSKREKEQYSKVLPWLTSDDEKIEFLKLGSVDERQAWINSNGIWKRAHAPGSDVREAIETGDISVGMPMDYVKRAWGEPQSVEVSGNPLYKNERWRYTKQISTQDGFRQEKRLVYFERGRVVGWETL